MVVDNMSKLRLFLLGCGFVQETQTVNQEFGTFYRYWIPEYELLFFVDITKRMVEARYPDKTYNSANPYSTKQCATNIDWQEEDSVETVIENLTIFFNKIMDTVMR